MAVAAWAGLVPAPAFVLQLGDLLDGHATSTALGSETTLERVLSAFESLERNHCAVHHCLGNHEFYNFPGRAFWRDRLACFRTHAPDTKGKGSPCCYYAFSPHPRFCFINLDSYDVSVLGSATGSHERADAEAVLLSKNHNEDLNSGVGLEGLETRFRLFNGGLGPRQLAWLRETLGKAQDVGQHIVIFSHIPFHPDVCTSDCLLWNYDAVLAVLADYAGLVKLCLGGHCHEARTVWDARTGTWHYTLDAPLEQEEAFSTAHVYADRIEIQGFGGNASIKVNLRPHTTCTKETK